MCLGADPFGGAPVQLMACPDRRTLWELRNFPKVRSRTMPIGYQLRNVASGDCIRQGTEGVTSSMLRLTRCFGPAAANLAEQAWSIAADAKVVSGLGRPIDIESGDVVVLADPVDVVKDLRRELRARHNDGTLNADMLVSKLPAIEAAGQMLVDGDTDNVDRLTEGLFEILELFQWNGLNAEAEPIIRQLATFAEQRLPACDSTSKRCKLRPDQAAYFVDTVSWLADVHRKLGQPEKSLGLLKRAVQIVPALGVLGNRDDALLFGNQFAGALIAVGAHERAEKQLWDSLEDYDRQTGVEPTSAQSRLSRALLSQPGVFATGIPGEQAESAEIRYADAFELLGDIYTDRNWLQDAKFLYSSAAEQYRLRPDRDPALADVLLKQSKVERLAGDLSTARRLISSAEKIIEEFPDDGYRLALHTAKAGLAASDGDVPSLLAASGAARAILSDVIARGSGRLGAAASTVRQAYETTIFELLDDLWLVGGGVGEPVDSLVDEAFLLIQARQQSQAALAAHQAGTRLALKDAEAEAQALRLERLQSQLAEVEGAQDNVRSDKTADPVSRRALMRKERDLRSEIGVANAELQQIAPGYFDAISPPAAALPATIEHLERFGQDMMLFAFGKDHSYAVLVTPAGAAWSRLAISRTELELSVDGIRVSIERREDGTLPDFDMRASNRLYKQLIEPFGAQPSPGRGLVVVPDGALLKLPLAVLITSLPEAADNYLEAGWMRDRHDLTTVPSVSSLFARSRVEYQAASRAMLGIGDPTLRREMAKVVAKPPAMPFVTKKPGGLNRGDSGLESLCLLTSLPETADELESTARLVGTDSKLLLANDAYERDVRSELAMPSRILHFATHGLLAGEWRRSKEPGLVLSVDCHDTDVQRSEDDGYLTASDIMAVRLPSELVILSACNTGGPADDHAGEGLSGLARAFLFAGARSLLASHWKVDSATAVKLITRTIELARADQNGRGLAGALGAAMQEIAADPDQHEWAHPYFWAPFMLVGDGAARLS
ncbi:MAG: CHAT domain-containing protein [Hyphomicrobiales bacterium]